MRHFWLDRQRTMWFLCHMAKTFKFWDVDQLVLLPPSVHELVPAGHLAHFVRDTVRDSLDLAVILDTYTEERGFPPYHPVMMTALLLYAYCQGLYASRRIAKACEERVDVMAVTARQTPDFRTPVAISNSSTCGRVKFLHSSPAGRGQFNWLSRAWQCARRPPSSASFCLRI